MSFDLATPDLAMLYEQQAQHYGELADLHTATLQAIPPAHGWEVQVEVDRRNASRRLALEYRRCAALERAERVAAAGEAL